MTNEEIMVRLRTLVATERKITREVLELIRLGEQRKLHLERGYTSSFEWLLREFGYSHSAAYRRIQASRFMAEIPDVGTKLESGALNLSVVAELKSAISAEEKRAKAKIPVEEIRELITKIENKPIELAQQILRGRFPDSKGPRQSLKRINELESRLNIVINNDCRANLERARDVLSHVFPDGQWADVIDFSTQTLLEDRDPLTQSAAVTEALRTITPALRALVFQRAQGRCEFVYEETGHRCESNHQLEVDHIQPKALGGTNDPTNLRALCRSHNQYEAERILGKFR